MSDKPFLEQLTLPSMLHCANFAHFWWISEDWKESFYVSISSWQYDTSILTYNIEMQFFIKWESNKPVCQCSQLLFWHFCVLSCVRGMLCKVFQHFPYSFVKMETEYIENHFAKMETSNDCPKTDLFYEKIDKQTLRMGNALLNSQKYCGAKLWGQVCCDSWG